MWFTLRQSFCSFSRPIAFSPAHGVLTDSRAKSDEGFCSRAEDVAGEKDSSRRSQRCPDLDVAFIDQSWQLPTRLTQKNPKFHFSPEALNVQGQQFISTRIGAVPWVQNYLCKAGGTDSRKRRLRNRGVAVEACRRNTNLL